MCSNKNGDCCADFQFKNGVCEPCYGSFGVNCTEKCKKGFYGFGCRSTCICEAGVLCDNRFGCIENLPIFAEQCLSLPFIVACIGIGCLCLLLFAYILYKRFSTKHKGNRSTCARAAEGEQEMTPSWLGLESRAIQSSRSTSHYGNTIHSNIRYSNNLHLPRAQGPVSTARDSFYSQRRCTKALSVYSYDGITECNEEYNKLETYSAQHARQALLPPPGKLYRTSNL